MAAVVFGLLLLQELTGNVYSFRQVVKNNEHIFDTVGTTRNPEGGGGGGDTGHELDDTGGDALYSQDEGASALSQFKMTEHLASFVRGSTSRDDDEDECDMNMKPQDTDGWFKMAHADDNSNLYLCLNNEKKKVVFFNAILALKSKNAAILSGVKEKLGLKTEAYTLGASTENAVHYFVYTQKPKEGDASEMVFKYTGGDISQVLANASSCPKEAQCSFLEVDKLDLEGIEDGEPNVKDCKTRVTKLIYDLGKGELEVNDNFDGFSLFNQDFDYWAGDVENDKTAYCKFGDIMEDYIDANTPQKSDEGAISTQCAMVPCNDHEGVIPYEKWYKCTFGMNKFKAFPAILLFLLVWFLQMGVLADGYLVPALVKIGRGLQMSDALLGATLLALGGAANDFMAGLASALAEIGKFNKAKEEEIATGIPMDERNLDEVELWLGGVFGTGFFVNTLVAALVMIFAPPEGIAVTPAVITRDICFRILAVSTMIVFGLMKTINPLHCVVMISMYLFYVFLTLREAKNAKEEAAPMTSNAQSSGLEQATSRVRADSAASAGSRTKLSRSSVLSFAKTPQEENGGLDRGLEGCDAVTDYNTNIGDLPVMERIAQHMGYDPDAGIMDKMGFVAAFPARPFFIFTLATNSWDPVVSPLLPLGMGIFFPFGSAGLFEAILGDEIFTSTFYMWEYVISVSLGSVFSAVVFFMSMRSDRSEYLFPRTFAWATFVMSILWLGLLANEILDALGCTAEMFNISKINAGITFLAWGNCIDNVFATIGLAKAKEFGVAITGIYAAPMFNVLFGQGITLLFVTCMKKGYETDFVMSTSALIILCTLVVILACTLLYTKVCGWRMTRNLGIALAILYPTVLLVAFTAGTQIDQK